MGDGTIPAMPGAGGVGKLLRGAVIGTAAGAGLLVAEAHLARRRDYIREPPHPNE